jgi:hypothetical protein
MDEYYTPERIRHHTDELARGGRGEALHALESEWRKVAQGPACEA